MAELETPEVVVETPAADVDYKAENARLKAALDKATKEAGDAKKALRAKQSEEEAAEAERKEAYEAQAKELADFKKRFEVAEIAKKAMGFVGDEATANTVAESIYGAENADAVIAAFNKAWTAKEKALRLEFGKIPAPGAGVTSGPTVTKEQLDAMSYTERIEFANKNHDEYERLMGRIT